MLDFNNNLWLVAREYLSNSSISLFLESEWEQCQLTKRVQTEISEKNPFKIEARKQPKNLMFPIYTQNLYAVLFAEHIIIYFMFISYSYSSIHSLSNRPYWVVFHG